jgi:glycosyltransferase involved in cell wall biosynthesis
MLKVVSPMPRTLDRAKWHKPLVSIIVTHYNYSVHLEDCLLSILDQTHDNWECVVVDDASEVGEKMAAEEIVKNIGDPRIRIWMLNENIGQIAAFYAGLDQTSGEFVCGLDPDDRYCETFLAEMVAAHLNKIRYCPVISCDQYLIRNNQVITGVRGPLASRLNLEGLEVGVPVTDLLRWFPPSLTGWLWSSTSSLMFRRPVLAAMKPHRELGYHGDLDGYIATGAHMLGGAMFLMKTLTYRGVHENNDWLRGDVWGLSQRARRLPGRAARTRADVIEAIIANDYGLDLPAQARPPVKRSLPQRLRRSIAKRWKRWTAASEAVKTAKA